MLYWNILLFAWLSFRCVSPHGGFPTSFLSSCVNMIPFHLSCSPPSLSSGLEILIACCTVTFPVSASQLPAHTLSLMYPQVPCLPPFFRLCTPFASACSSSPSSAHLSAFVTRVTGFTICRCGSNSPLIFQYNANAGWWRTCGIFQRKLVLSLFPFLSHLPFSVKTKGKQTATASNYHIQRTKKVWSVFSHS